MKLAIVLLRDRHLALASILLIAPLRGVMSHVNGVISMLGDTCFEQGYVISLSYGSTHARPWRIVTEAPGPAELRAWPALNDRCRRRQI